ncbi:MAG: type III secretion protein [Proteobacteria bacterium]|nr:type III secretion protein [Pseudomonadota bacterium]
MTFESLLQLDPKVWPLAVMLFLRIVSVLFFLPIFGDANIPSRIRILLALTLSICIWPAVEKDITATQGFIQWSPLALALATIREVFFGFAVGFAAKLLSFAAAIAANIVGVNMGFQTATLFSPQTGTQESSFTSLKVWLITILILTFNIHHVFIQGIVSSFVTIPFASSADPQLLLNIVMQTLTNSFDIGLRIAAPLLLIQTLCTLALGLLNRALPQLNAFVISFPLSFLLSMVVLFFSSAAFVRLIGEHGGTQEVTAFSRVQKAFDPKR